MSIIESYNQEEQARQVETPVLNVSVLVVGLGKTGLSVARYLLKQGVSFAVADSRECPPGKDELAALNPDTDTFYGEFDEALFLQAEQLIVSPGISITATPAIAAAQHAGIEIIGDVELFAREVKAPVIAITGSNGKTTVAKLMGQMVEDSGKSVSVIGNVGTPCLDVLALPVPDLYVLELSSFQMETTHSLNAIAAVVLNISEDHLDRYDGLADYANAKARLYRQCQNLVINRDDAYVDKLATENYRNNKGWITFGLDEPVEQHFGIRRIDDVEYLVHGTQILMPVSEVKLPGKHNVSNGLAALAMGDIAGLDMQGMLSALRSFAGVEHRTQWVADVNGVNWYNDSKGTNVGATLAALSGFEGKTVLIAGGQGKGSDFSPLANAIANKARAVVLMGEDADKIEAVLDEGVKRVYANTMDEAVKLAAEIAQVNDNVLLSPACASFDMFANYEARGHCFMDSVRRLAA